MEITPANAARLFHQHGSARAVAREMNITRPRALRLLHIANVDLSRKSMEQLHPRPENAQEIYDQCGSSRVFGAKYGVSQRQANKILNMWGVTLTPSGRDDASREKQDAKARRVWCSHFKKPCVMFGSGECAACKFTYAYKLRK